MLIFVRACVSYRLYFRLCASFYYIVLCIFSFLKSFIRYLIRSENLKMFVPTNADNLEIRIPNPINIAIAIIISILTPYFATIILPYFIIKDNLVNFKYLT